MISHHSSEPFTQDMLVAEYTGLRDEINSNSMVAAQTVTIAFTAAVAFISFGLERQNWLIFFAPVVLNTILAVFVASQYDSTVRIAAYIRRRFEEGAFTELMWESGMNVIRTRFKKDMPTFSYVSSLALTFILLNLTSCGLSVYFFQQAFGSPLDRIAAFGATDASYFALLLVGGWLILLALSFFVVAKLRGSFSSKRFAHHYELWKRALTIVGQEAAPPRDTHGLIGDGA
jgi:hypothetical protein